MKVQKLGLVLGMNMAVACLMMQGCKANKAKTDLPPDTTTVVAPAAAPTATATTDNGMVATTSSLTPTATTPTTTTTTAGAVPSGVIIEPAPEPNPETPVTVATKPSTTATPVARPLPPSKVRTVNRLPPQGKPTPVARKTAAATSAATTAPAGAAPSLTATTAPAATGFVYTVKPGDQLFAVTRKYNVRLDAVKKANPGLNPDRIKIGQKIVIPGVAAPAPTAVAATAPATSVRTAPTTMLAAAPAPTAANTVPPVKTKPAFKAYVGPTKEYKVQPGDSLGKIAYENGITIRALKELNKLTKDQVRAGSTLLIPAEKVVATKTSTDAKAPTAKPTVETKKPEAAKPADPAKVDTKTEPKPGAEVKPDEKKDEPKIDAPTPKKDEPKVDVPAEKKDEPVVEQPKVDEAKPAPEAAAPAAPAGNFTTYTVKEGDDLVSISITWGISPSQLMDLNGLKAGDSVKPGQVLKLPAGAKPTEE